MKDTIQKFKQGTIHSKLSSAVTKKELKNSNTHMDLSKYDVVKFIPASGAATRMFQDLYLYLETNVETDFVNHFINNIQDFAFYDELELEGLNKKETIKKVLNTYGNSPKALIKIHKYEQALTPIDEHIYEGTRYISDNVKLHFTISEEHESSFVDYIKKYSDFDITYSFQFKSTDTLAVDEFNEPFIKEDGEVLYRAGGHGSLLHNLDKIDADIIFIKNIDNVCHRSMIEDTISSKKELASIGLEMQKTIFDHIIKIEQGNYDLNEINQFLKEELNITYKESLTKEKALEFLKRPLKVCGVVKNTGEPGGGPFIVDNGTYTDPQILEMKEIDLEKDQSIVDNAAYFNPVDLVCFIKDKQGKKYNLLDYTNEDRYFISEKSYKGRTLKAIEHPGLWNGAMHNWNTVFVEVPLSTFNPIKTVNDLLRKGHKGN